MVLVDTLQLVAAAGFIGGAVHALLTMWSYGRFKGEVASALASGPVGLLAAVALLALIPLAPIETLWQLLAVSIYSYLTGYVGADVVDTLYVLRLQRSRFLH